MQRNPRYFAGKAPPADAYDVSGYGLDSTVAGHEHHHDFPAPLNNIEFQPSETCPRNFVIFDQTCHRSRVMFHPSLAHKLGSPGLDVHGSHAYEAGKSVSRDDDEDAEDIDALLSSEEGEDDDVVSTGRTPGRREKMKKMVKTLKGIIPCGDRMDTPAVLDEAVKYLKSLKVEVKKLGMKHLDH
ncbi:HLH [Musa troglodytarum]|uniref:HLH n=1 Tax=Musa troglodytarum TaxID=320322 RepID=A0A9E7KDQ3_9LILI|nr:HLH [Musa troglodytarum]